MEKILFDLMADVKATRNNYRYGSTPLQDLHDAFGFDFNEPIICGKKKGAFTPCALAKEFTVDFKDYVVILLMKERCYYNLVRLYADSVDINLYGTNWFNTFYTKADYNDSRKYPCNGDTWVIAQKKEYIKRTPRSFDADLNKRYIEERSWRIVEMFTGKTANRAYDLDKSGYPVELKRDYLEMKKKTVLAEKAKRAYEAMDNKQDMIERAKKAIEAKKKNLQATFGTLNTFREIQDFRDNLYYIVDSFRKVEEIEENVQEDYFTSPANFNNAIAYIYRNLEKI